MTQPGVTVQFFETFHRPGVCFLKTANVHIKCRLPDAIMKNKLIVAITIVGAVILAAAFPLLLWKLTAHTAADRPVENGAGHYLTKEKMAFVGYATPEDAFQSIARAVAAGDSDKVFDCLTPQAQVAIGKQPNGREQFAANTKRNGQNFKGLQITARKVLADDLVELKFKIDPSSQAKKGPSIPAFQVQGFAKIDGAWKISGPTKPYTPDWDNGSQPEPVQ